MTIRNFSARSRIAVVGVLTAGIVAGVGVAVATASSDGDSAAPIAPAAYAQAAAEAEDAAIAVLREQLAGSGVSFTGPDYDVAKQPTTEAEWHAMDQRVRDAEKASCAEVERRLAGTGVPMSRDDEGELTFGPEQAAHFMSCGAYPDASGGMDLEDSEPQTFTVTETVTIPAARKARS